MPVEKWNFQDQPEFFTDLAALESHYPNNKVTTQPGLGLLPGQKYSTDKADKDALDEKDWTRFAAYVRWLNRTSPEKVAYKVLYLTRHGYGYHNQKHAEVGTLEWDVSVIRGREMTGHCN